MRASVGERFARPDLGAWAEAKRRPRNPALYASERRRCGQKKTFPLGLSSRVRRRLSNAHSALVGLFNGSLGLRPAAAGRSPRLLSARAFGALPVGSSR